MIPLHLSSTTVHVTREEADALIAQSVAEWLDLGVPALRATERHPDRRREPRGQPPPGPHASA